MIRGLQKLKTWGNMPPWSPSQGTQCRIPVFSSYFHVLSGRLTVVDFGRVLKRVRQIELVKHTLNVRKSSLFEVRQGPIGIETQNAHGNGTNSAKPANYDTFNERKFS